MFLKVAPVICRTCSPTQRTPAELFRGSSAARAFRSDRFLEAPQSGCCQTWKLLAEPGDDQVDRHEARQAAAQMINDLKALGPNATDEQAKRCSRRWYPSCSRSASVPIWSSAADTNSARRCLTRTSARSSRFWTFERDDDSGVRAPSPYAFRRRTDPEIAAVWRPAPAAASEVRRALLGDDRSLACSRRRPLHAESGYSKRSSRVTRVDARSTPRTASIRGGHHPTALTASRAVFLRRRHPGATFNLGILRASRSSTC